MRINLLPITPAFLFLKSVALLAITFFFPYWALFYHHEYESLVFASPWILCARRQCKLIKNIGQAEACRAALLVSLLLSLPLGLSVPAQCFGILSSSLPELMPFFTSVICLIIGSTEFLAFVFFRLLMTQLKFLLKEFTLWLNWPVYVLLLSSAVYIVVGSLIFHHHLRLSGTQPSKKQSAPPDSITSEISPGSEASQPSDAKPADSPETLEVFWLSKSTKATLSPKPSESTLKPQSFRPSFSQLSNRSWISEKPWGSPNSKATYPLGFRVQSFFIDPPSLSSSTTSTSKNTDP